MGGCLIQASNLASTESESVVLPQSDKGGKKQGNEKEPPRRIELLTYAFRMCCPFI
ncbi:hypothetical protein Pan241w_47710 [Gimesia alba]|uniref:Uncharacterized protein n=1 Tax=Gimesia alba TaxID=2527973 RepID=A0A517RLA3_9PLAN|nr:hypothetical protein Pan241w_47710 [Gimesia alba]